MQPFSSVRAYPLLPMLAFVASACGGSTVQPTTPTPGVTPVSNGQVFTQITGAVSDTADRPLRGVRVEIVDRFQTLASALSDENGSFTFSGSFVGPVTGRAEKDGYVTASRIVLGQNTIPPSPSGGWLFFFLEPLAAPVKIDDGDYTLTIMADSACTGLPDDVRTRTYAATVTSNANIDLPPNTQYVVKVAGTKGWLSEVGGFGIGVAGNYVAVTDDTGPEMTEQITPSRSLEFNAWGGTTVESPTVSTLSFSGDLNYCELNSVTGKSCSACQQNTRIILTRRNPPTLASLRSLRAVSKPSAQSAPQH